MDRFRGSLKALLPPQIKSWREWVSERESERRSRGRETKPAALGPPVAGILDRCNRLRFSGPT